MPDHRKLPAFQSIETLAQALDQTLGPPTDPDGLTARLWRSAAAAAAAISRGSALPVCRFADLLDEGVERLEDLSFTLDLAVRRHALDLGAAVELLEHQTRARIEMVLLRDTIAGQARESRVAAADDDPTTSGVESERQLELVELR